MPLYDMRNAEKNTELYNQMLEEQVLETPKSATPSGEKKQSRGRKFFSFLILSVLLIGAIFVGNYLYTLYRSTSDTFSGSDRDLLSQIAGTFGAIQLPGIAPKQILGQSEGRTNLLVLGVDVEAELTDTITILSYYHKEKKMVSLSIPRDFVVFDGYEQIKINAVMKYANAREPNSGVKFLNDFLAREYGITLHYWLTISFHGVQDVIDRLGGVTVNVERGFIDYQYPDENYGYLDPPPSFKPGVQQMDGRTALIYARSRKATDPVEATDFARSRRQSIIIQAVLEKFKQKLNAGDFNNVDDIKKLVEIMGKNMKTSVPLDDLVSAYLQFKDMKDWDINKNFYRINWTNNNGFICEDDTFNLMYCGGSIAGYDNQSEARQEARNSVENMLAVAQRQSMLDTQIAVLGNGSFDTQKAYNVLDHADFVNVVINNQYAPIKAATQESKEQALVYIPDSDLRKLFEAQKFDFGVPTKYVDTLPPDIKMTDQYKDAKVLIFIVSIVPEVKS